MLANFLSSKLWSTVWNAFFKSRNKPIEHFGWFSKLSLAFSTKCANASIVPLCRQKPFWFASRRSKTSKKFDILLYRNVSKTFATVGSREIGLKLDGSWTSRLLCTATMIASFRQGGKFLSSIHLLINFVSISTITHSSFFKKSCSIQSNLCYIWVAFYLLFPVLPAKWPRVSRIDCTLILLLLETFWLLDSKFDAKVLPTVEKYSINLSAVSLLSLSCNATLLFNLLMQIKKDFKFFWLSAFINRW